MLMDVDGTVYACLVLYIVYSIILYVHSYIVCIYIYIHVILTFNPYVDSIPILTRGFSMVA